MIVSTINIVLSSLLLNNFMYNYFVGAEFFRDCKGRKKIDLVVDLFIILASTFVLNTLVYIYYPNAVVIDEVYYLINILNINLSILFIGRLRDLKGRRVYYGITTFLIWLLSYSSYENIYALGLTVFIIPTFIYLNLLFFQPLFEKLELEGRRGLVSYNAIFMITIAIMALIFNAFTGWY